MLLPTPTTLLPSEGLYPEVPDLDLAPYGQRLYDSLSLPGAGERGLPEVSNALGILSGAMAAPHEQVAWIRGLGTDLEPYRQAMKVATAPSWLLPWIAQFVGVTIPKGSTVIEARNIILARTNQLRGQPETIRNVVRSYLNAPQYVFLEEHANGDPFYFRVFIRASQIKVGYTSTDVTKAIADVKPAGFDFDLLSTAGVAWDEAVGTWNAAQGPWDNPGNPPTPGP